MFTHQSSPKAYDATWEAKSTWLPEINRRVVRRNSSVRFTCYHVQELPVLSQHLQPITELGTSLHDESLRMCLIWERSYMTCTPGPGREVYIPLSLESILLGHKQIGFGWTFLSVHPGHPAKRSICENDRSLEPSFAWTLEMERTSECLDSLFHWSPVVVDLIQHINDSPTEKYCWIVKVVHEAGKLI